MSRPVSIVIPVCAGTEVLADHMPPLLHEVKQRKLDDEVIVVDDTAGAGLREWFEKDFPSVGGITHVRTRGYGKSLLSGARAAKHDLVLCLAPGIRAREGFLAPLVECLENEGVFAASPRVMSEGSSQPSPLSDTALLPATEDAAGAGFEQLGVLDERAFLIHKRELKRGHFADLFDPVCVDPSNLCLRAARKGARMMRLDASVVDYYALDSELAGRNGPLRSARERNALLSFWLHLDDPQVQREHLKHLWRIVLEVDERSSTEDLRLLVLALEKVPELGEARRAFSVPPTAPEADGQTITS